jgi:hypothetical protein
MIQTVVTGGQTGAEQAGWAAARRAGIVTAGYMPRGFMTEDGPAPRVGALYGAIEFPFDDAQRIRANLRRADGLLWFGDPDSPEAGDTFAACRELAKPFLTTNPGFTPPADVVAWLSVFETTTLVVSGDRASRVPGIGPQVEAFLDRTLAALRRAATRNR